MGENGHFLNMQQNVDAYLHSTEYVCNGIRTTVKAVVSVSFRSGWRRDGTWV